MNGKVGVAVGNRKMGGTKMIPPPLVGVADGGAATTAVLEGAPVGTIGVGGAAMEARVLGIQDGLVTEVEIHAYPPVPPANSIYHQALSKLFPATLAVPPCGSVPRMGYTCPGPLRTLATTEVVTVGAHASGAAVDVGVSVNTGVDVGVAVSPPAGASVAGAPPGILQASAASTMKMTAINIFLFFTSIRFSSKRICLYYRMYQLKLNSTVCPIS